MIRIAGRGRDIVNPFRWHSVKARFLGENPLAVTVSVDVFPCLGTVEGELIGTYPDNFTVLVMQILDIMGKLPGQ